MAKITLRGLAACLNRHKILFGIIVLAVGGYLVYRGTSTTNAATQYVMTSVKKGSVVASVDGTGQVLAVNQLDIKPQNSGNVISVNIKNGQEVKVGALLAVLDTRNAAASLAQARASYVSAQANEAKVKSGVTGTDIDLAKLSIDSATLSLKNAQTNLDRVKVQQDQAVTNAYTSLLNSSISPTPGISNLSGLSPTISGSYSGTVQGQYVIKIYNGGVGMRYMVTGLETGEGSIDSAAIILLGSHGLYLQFPAGNLHDGDNWTIDLPNTRAGNYLSNSNAYTTAKQNKDQAIQSAQSSVESAQNQLTQAKLSLASKQEAATPAELAVARAQVITASAGVQNAAIAYQNCFIRAPFDGKIASVGAKVGDQASGSTVIATLITTQLYVQAPFNEVDVAKIKVGQKATLTFDAIENLSIAGTVSEIQTIGTASQGVVNYNVNITFQTQDERVKPSMSASVAIVTDMKADVLTLPGSAVKTQSGQSYVEILSSVTSTDATQVTSAVPPVKRAVETGLSDSQAIEIVSGLDEGDLVVLQTISPAKAKTTAATTQSSSLRIPGMTGGGRPN